MVAAGSCEVMTLSGAGAAGLTVSVAALLVTDPAALATTTVNWSPLSELAVGAVE